MVMSDPLENPHFSEMFSEMYDIVRTVEVVVNEQRYRIEVVKGYSNTAIPYSIRCYVEENVTVQPTYPITHGRHEGKPEDIAVWTHFSLSWVIRDTADGALAQGLSFLHEAAGRRVNK